MRGFVIFLLAAGSLADPYVNLVNAALNKPAIQFNTDSDLVATKANDGQTSSCSNTLDTRVKWWMVDLLGDYELVAMNISNYHKIGYSLADISIFLHQVKPNDMTPKASKNLSNRMCLFDINGIPYGTSKFQICKFPLIGRYLNFYKASATLAICEVEALARTARSLQFRLYKAVRILSTPFYSTSKVSSGMRCVVQCMRAPGGSATAAHYRQMDGSCECMEVSGLFDPPKRENGLSEWNLYWAKNNPDI